MKIICVNCSFRDENESDLRSIEHYLSSSENRENFLALKNVQLFVWSVKHTNTYQKNAILYSKVAKKWLRQYSYVISCLAKQIIMSTRLLKHFMVEEKCRSQRERESLNETIGRVK